MFKPILITFFLFFVTKGIFAADPSITQTMNYIEKTWGEIANPSRIGWTNKLSVYEKNSNCYIKLTTKADIPQAYGASMITHEASISKVNVYYENDSLILECQNDDNRCVRSSYDGGKNEFRHNFGLGGASDSYRRGKVLKALNHLRNVCSGVKELF